MNKKIFYLSARSKYILSGLIFGAFILGGAVILCINDINNKLDKTYFDFAQMTAKTIAKQIDIDKDINILSKQFANILLQNNDISFIEYKDKNNNIIYSSKKELPNEDENTLISVSSQVLKDNKMNGSVTIGLTGGTIKDTSKDIKTALISIFAYVGLVLFIIFIINFILMTKELKKIYQGVKQISTGKFGYKLESENMPELTDAFNNMSNLLSQYEEQNIEQLTLERNKLEAVLMSIINGVIVCDNFDNVVLANSAALTMLDTDEKNFINKKIQNYIDSHGQQCFLDKIEEFKDTPLNIIEQKPVEFNI